MSGGEQLLSTRCWLDVEISLNVESEEVCHRDSSQEGNMFVSDSKLLAYMTSKFSWHQERERVESDPASIQDPVFIQIW